MAATQEATAPEQASSDIAFVDTNLDRSLAAATRLMAELGFHWWNIDVGAPDGPDETPHLCIWVGMSTTKDTYLRCCRAKAFGSTLSDLLHMIADMKRDIDETAREESVTVSPILSRERRLPWSDIPDSVPPFRNDLLGPELGSYIGKMVSKFGTFREATEEDGKNLGRID